MAFKKEDLQKIAEITKIPVADLEKAATDPTEIPLTVPDKLTVFTEGELNTFQKNKYEDGRKAGVEMGVKDAATKLGIEFGGKTIDGLLDAATKKALADADKNPDQRVTELTQKVNTLQQNVTTYQTQVQEKETAIAKLRDKYEVYKDIPAPVEGGVQYQQDDVITMMQGRGFEYKRDSNGVMGWYKGGELQQDKLGNALPIGDVVKTFMKEVKFLPTEEGVPGGRGAGDKGGGNARPRTASELRAQYEAAGKSANGEAFIAEFESLVKANDGFDPHK